MTYRYPLEWPLGWDRTPTVQRRDNRANKLTFDKIIDRVYTELSRLNASDVVITSWLETNMRGYPNGTRARSSLEDPGVAVYFTLRGKSMVMARDAFLNVADNLASLGLAIQYLRGLERHGGGTMMDRAFDGFLKLPHPDKAGWKLVLGNQDSLEDAEAIYKQKQRSLHNRSSISAEEKHDEAVKLNLAIEEARQFFREKAA